MNSVAVVIPHWNRRDDLQRCLNSLKSQTHQHQVIVVDNASTDGSAEMLMEQFPRAQIFRCERNFGFTGATNVGIELACNAGADYILLLNNDTVTNARLIEALVKFAAQDEKRGIVAPSIYLLQQPDRLWSAGGEILPHCACRQLTESGEQPRQVDYASGCALLVSRKLIATVGLLDPRFFMYFEEVDWCLRARQAGFEIWHLPQAKVWHAVSSSLGEKSLAVHYYMTRNRLLLLQKNRGRFAALRVMSSEYLRALAVAGLHRDRIRCQALRLAITDFLRQRFGERPRATLASG